MSMIKVIGGGAWDFHEPQVAFVKRSSRGLVGADRLVLEKRAGTSLLSQLDQIKTASDEPLIHLLAVGTTEDYGANRNGDGFRRIVCQHYHPTFTKHAHFFRDHRNKDPRKSFGIVKASAYNDAMKRIELIVALNGSEAAARRNNGLLADRELEKLASGKDIPVSMACRVPFDVCSWCGNKAPNREDYCDAIENGGLCKAGGLKHNIGTFVEMEKDGKLTLHQLHADNPNPTFFDISHVFRGADRIAYVMGQLEKAAGMCKVSGAQLAEMMGVTIPYELLLDQQYSGDVQQMLKLAYQLSDMEQEVNSGHFDRQYLPAFGATFHRSLGALPPLFQEKFASALRALADARVCWPLVNFIEVTAGYPLEKAAETAEIVARDLPGIYSRMLEQPGFADRIARSPYLPSAAAGPALRVWAEKQAEDYSLAENRLRHRLTLAAIRGTDNLSALRQGAHEKIAVDRSASDRLAEEYALYKLAFLSAVPETEPDFQLTASMVIMQNYAQ